MENPGVKKAAIPRTTADTRILISNANIPLFFISIPPQLYISSFKHIQTMGELD
jgi:hypothetical protein